MMRGTINLGLDGKDVVGEDMFETEEFEKALDTL